MINLTAVKQFCKDYTKIENYEEAMNDTTQTWICHHILGEILSREQLKDHDFYYDVPPCMLKFVTRAEHNRLHKKGRTSTFKGRSHSDETRRKMSEANKGHTVTDETRRKLSESLKGKPTWNKGKHLSVETRKKISEAHKGKTRSEETRRKMSEAAKLREARKREAISHLVPALYQP